MDVGSSFEIYGNLFGWYANNQIVSFVAATGIWIIPFFLILYSAIWGNRGGGEGHTYNPLGTLINLEIQFYLGILIVALFLTPVVSVNKTEFQYNDGVRTLTGGNTDSTYDTVMSNMPDTVKIPPAWYGILVITSGFNQVFKTALPTGTSTRQVMQQVNELKIKDDALKRQYEKFQNHCVVPASKRLSILMSEHGDSLLAKQIDQEFKAEKQLIDAKNQFTGDEYKIDPRSAGNIAYNNYLYDSSASAICKGTDPRGLSSLCIPAGIQAVPDPQNAGDVYAVGCKEWWNDNSTGAYVFGTGLKEFLQKDVNKQIADDNWVNIPASIKNTFYNSDKQLYAYISRSNLNTGGLNRGLNNKEGFAGFKQNVGEVLTAAGLSFNNFVDSTFTNQVVRFGLPIAHGAIVLFFIIVLPILIIFGRYQPSMVGGLAVAYFGLLMLTGIWHFISWLDNVVIEALFGDQGYTASLVSLSRQMWNAFVLISYLLFTILWLMFVKEMGGTTTRALSAALGGGVAGAAGAKTAASLSGRGAASAGASLGNSAVNRGTNYIGGKFQGK